jgi:hypothetical protein
MVAMFLRFALRDLGIIGAAAAVWYLLAGQSIGTGFVADVSGVVAGLTLGAAAYVLHEWGHLLAAFASRSTVRPGAHVGSFFIFGFDARQNSLRQFLVMSVGGFIATALLVWGFYTYLPDDLLATRVARGVVVFLAVLAIVLEFPLVVWGLVKRAVPAPVDVTHGRRAPKPA